MNAHSGRGSRPSKAKKSRNGFFALDVNQFERIRRLGLGVEDAATYLSLLKSTDQTNVVSSGGVQSVMTYAGLTRAETRKAVARLERHGLLESLEVARKRARTASRYNLPIHDNRAELSRMERDLVEGLQSKQQPAGTRQTNAAHRAASKGWIEKRSGRWEVVEHANTVAFIPNGFVDAASGNSPLSRLVNVGELGPIMLAAELYQLQNLMDDRGVPPEIIRAYYRPESLQRIGQHNLYCFVPGRIWTDVETDEEKDFPRAYGNWNWRADTETFWNDLRVLDATHVIEWAIFSANGKPDSEHDFRRPQWPLGVLRNKRQVLKTPESRPAFMAYLVSLLIESGGQALGDIQPLIDAWKGLSPLIALENMSVPHVEAVGILRMTTRAQTANTSVWYRDLCRECEKTFFFIDQIARTNFPDVVDITDIFATEINTADAISI